MRLALIVDDSKTARLLLKKMLTKHDIPVAMAQSGEDALEYLDNNSPDVIFMDHMMPGMDGFDTVKAIKADPEKASIPIVMHTTKQGDIYLGQARALGAVDILTKPASSENLSRILDKVKSIGDQSAVEASPFGDPVAPVSPLSPEAPPVVRPAPLPASDMSTVVEPSFIGTFRQWLFLFIWLAPVLWLLNLYLTDQSEIELLKRQQAETLTAIELLMNRQQTYDYGEIPMGGGRLALLEAVLPLLEKSGFTGAIRIEGHVGDFCLSQIPLADGTEVMMLPPPDLPLTACDVIGLSSAGAMRLSIEESPEFASLRQQYQLGDSDIRIELAAYGATAPLYSYSVDLEGVSTGDWNAVALDNNRVNYVLLSD